MKQTIMFIGICTIIISCSPKPKSNVITTMSIVEKEKVIKDSTLLQSDSTAGIDDELLFSGFHQGPQNDCASVAFIKAALNVYGLNNLFIIDTIKPSVYKVTLKNGNIDTITSQQIQLATDSAHFILNDVNNVIQVVIKKYAELTFCIMVAEKMNVDNIKTFPESLNRLCNGANTPSIYQYLGFIHDVNVQYLTWHSSIRHSIGIVAWKSNHAVFVSRGFMDNHGSKCRLKIYYYGKFQVI